MGRKGKRLFIYAAANWLGYQVPEERPPRSDAEASKRAMRGIRTFYQAIIEGRAPPSDGKEGARNWWYEETIIKHIEASEFKSSKRGRPAKAGAL